MSLLKLAKDAKLKQKRDRLFMNSDFLYSLLTVHLLLTHLSSAMTSHTLHLIHDISPFLRIKDAF